MAYTIHNRYQLDIILLLITLGVLPEFKQCVRTVDFRYRVAFRDDKISLWSTPSSTP